MYPNRDGHRSEFFLHGGKNLGSAGCIDVGNQDAELFAFNMYCKCTHYFST